MASPLGSSPLKTSPQAATDLNLKSTGNIINTNKPIDAEGRLYHLGVKKGEISDKAVIVGDPLRAKLVAEKHLKPIPELPGCFPYISNRGFVVYSGLFNGEFVSVVGTGMGTTMIDFFMREWRSIIDGKMKVIRLGSCGSPNENISVGTVVVANKVVKVVDDQRPWEERKATGTKYTITNGVYPNQELHQKLLQKLKEANAFPVFEGTAATTDSFYSSQGRIDPAFPDQNEHLIEELEKKEPGIAAISMEAYHIFNLADMNTAVAEPGKGIEAAACKIVLAARKAGIFITNDQKHEVEDKAGKACLEALVA